MASAKAAPVLNNLLDGIPSKDRQHFLAACEQVELVYGDVLYELGEKMHYVYFPTESFISLVMPIDDKSSLEVGLVGNEGMYGATVILGIEASPFQSVIQGAGPAIRIGLPAFLNELEQNAALLRKLKRYLYVKVRQMAQTAACNRFHLVEQRLARWLLMTKDRAHAEEFHITQEFLSEMLGVRRVGVTKAAGALQRKQLISYSRGALQIRDVAGLEDAACSCYLSDKAIYDRILNH